MDEVLKMWTIPKKIILTSGVGEGITPLNSLDKALLSAGVGNFNLIKVTSIVPAEAEVVENYQEKFIDGMLMPAVYTYITSNIPNEKISSGIIVGIPKNKNQSGLIFEVSKSCSLAKNKEECMIMITEGFKNRNIDNFSIKFVGKEAVVEKGFTTVVSVALLLK